ncbi:MAG: glutamate--tRNA ligase [Planctomycetota bacterium]|jgi:glutamyl-tRNA synthetase
MYETAVVRTRFAPSPSGNLHVGGARTALFSWAYARGRGGEFILRIEDTDRKRSSDAASLAFLEDLRWLGIEWDEGPVHEGLGGGERGPYVQSERLDVYRGLVVNLVAEGKAYPAFETPEELDAARARARAEKWDYRYDRAARRLDPETVAQYLAEGRPHVVRLAVPDDREVVVRDTVLGEVRTPPEKLDDFVIRKADGYPTYHFAVVVDDELMGVTHVLRGQEHLMNAPRHVLLQEALGFRTPVYAHIPLIFNPDGSKMSKRDKDRALRGVAVERGLTSAASVDAETFDWWLDGKDHQLDLETAERLAAELGVDLPEINVEDFRRAGYLPSVVTNYLALLGWSPGGDVEKFDSEFLVERFDLDRIVKSPAKFDRTKLKAFNLDAIQEMSEEEFEVRYREHCARYHPEFLERLDAGQFALLARANRIRAKTLEDTIPSSRLFVAEDDEIVYEDTKAVRKALVKGDPSGFAHLEAIRELLNRHEDFSVHGLETLIQAYADEHGGGKLGKVAQPLRIAVSGTTVSPAIYDTLAILGKEHVLRRIERCLAARGGFAEGA